MPQTVSWWKVQVVWAGHYPFLSWNSCLQDYGHCMVMMHVQHQWQVSLLRPYPAWRWWRRKSTSWSSGNTAGTCRCSAAGKHPQRGSKKSGPGTPSLSWWRPAVFSDFSTFHNRALLYRIIRTAPTLCTCLTFRPQPTLGWILRLRCADCWSLHEPEKTRYW